MNQKQPETLFKVLFSQNEQVFEIYAKQLGEADMMGFVVAEELIFTDVNTLLVDPSEEKLKAEFRSVQRTYIPMHAILRIDEVTYAACPKIKPAPTTECNKISRLPHVVKHKSSYEE